MESVRARGLAVVALVAVLAMRARGLRGARLLGTLGAALVCIRVLDPTPMDGEAAKQGRHLEPERYCHGSHWRGNHSTVRSPRGCVGRQLGPTVFSTSWPSTSTSCPFTSWKARACTVVVVSGWSVIGTVRTYLSRRDVQARLEDEPVHNGVARGGGQRATEAA